MVNVRYHLVTIAAIFLALGIGILLGGTAGQSWFAARQQEFLLKMEEKYDQALRSNNELKQQVNELIVQVERNNEEVIHLMAARYAGDLQGQKLYVWRPDGLEMAHLERVLASVGVQTVPFQPAQSDYSYPLLLFGKGAAGLGGGASRRMQMASRGSRPRFARQAVAALGKCAAAAQGDEVGT